MLIKPITQIGMRDFMRNMKEIKADVLKGQEFEVLDHATPVFRVVPLAKVASSKYSFADLSKFQFASNSKTLANDIDKLVYGN